MQILVIGGAGFVGSNLAQSFKKDSAALGITGVSVLDNLKRRGSEINLPEFKKQGIQFFHGDIRNPTDLMDLPGTFDLVVDASAEPSVLAGLQGTPSYVLQTNLVGTLNCLEFARARAGRMLFLSTSRVYSIEPLKQIRLDESATRFEIAERQTLPGISPKGIAEEFPTHLPRSLYGASKLASELIIQEYADTYGMKVLMNRCGVIAGPGQFGKVDQGVFTLWVLHHHFGKPLKYTGFGGQGKQVRDLLHPADLYDLLKSQLEKPEHWKGSVFNVGGGRAISTSMAEFTAVCQKVTGKSIAIASDPKTSPVDIPLYVSDHSKVTSALGWKPKRSVETIVGDIHSWIRKYETQLEALLG